jgi:hypothetical protein
VPTTAPAPAVAAPVTISPAAYGDPDKGRAEIDNFVKLNLENLLNDGNADAQSKAREVMTTATMAAGAPASPTFLFNYGQSLNNAFSAKLATPKKLTIRQRLNLAVVTAKVAYMANNITLQQTTMTLLKDESEPVVLWGLRAAQPQVPQLLSATRVGNKVPAMIPAITKAVFDHPSGPIFDEGYQALTGEDKAVADELMNLWQNRLVQYQTKVPQDPSADGKPAFKLSTQDMWKKVVTTPQFQQKVMQMVVDQLSAAQQWADQSGGEDAHAQLVALARQCASACAVVGVHQKMPELANAGTAANGKLDPKNFPTGAKVGPIVEGVVKLVLANFKGVQQPPQVGPGPGGNPGAAGVAGQQ